MNALETNECKHYSGFLVRWETRTIIKVRSIPNFLLVRRGRGSEVKYCSAFDEPTMEMTSKKIGNDSKPLTTFVQADTKTFKDVVQRLTGSSEEAARESSAPLSINQGGAFWQQHFQEQHKFSPSSSGNRVLQTSPTETPTKCFSSLSLVERELTGTTDQLSQGTSLFTTLTTIADSGRLRSTNIFTHHPHTLIILPQAIKQI